MALDVFQTDTSAVFSICNELRLASSQDLKHTAGLNVRTGVLQKLKFRGLTWFG